MREQNILAKTVAAARGDRVHRHAGQRPAELERLARDLQRHQPGPWLDDGEIEAARYIICESRRAHLRNREAAGREHDAWRDEAALVGLDAEAVAASYFADAVAGAQVDAGGLAFRQQHR